MKVRIQETNEATSLTIEQNGIDYASDFIGNHGAAVDEALTAAFGA